MNTTKICPPFGPARPPERVGRRETTYVRIGRQPGGFNGLSNHRRSSNQGPISGRRQHSRRLLFRLDAQRGGTPQKKVRREQALVAVNRFVAIIMKRQPRVCWRAGPTDARDLRPPDGPPVLIDRHPHIHRQGGSHSVRLGAARGWRSARRGDRRRGSSRRRMSACRDQVRYMGRGDGAYTCGGGGWPGRTMPDRLVSIDTPLSRTQPQHRVAVVVIPTLSPRPPMQMTGRPSRRYCCWCPPRPSPTSS